MLDTVTALKEKLRTENIIDIIVGNETAEVTDNQYDELETYGGKGWREETWLSIMQQAEIEGYLEKRSTTMAPSR